MIIFYLLSQSPLRMIPETSDSTSDVVRCSQLIHVLSDCCMLPNETG